MATATPIERFWGKHRFLSNFYPATVVLDDALYPTVEHAYQAAKTQDLSARARIRMAKTPGNAKALGRRVHMRYNWDQIKLTVMEDLLRQKFKGVDMRRALLATGDAPLIEGNTWHDTYWGVCNGEGENHLGKLLMKVRDDLARPWLP